jgi:hypothetical protein
MNVFYQATDRIAQDLDKQITMDMTQIEYANMYSIIAYVDSDELLVSRDIMWGIDKSATMKSMESSLKAQLDSSLYKNEEIMLFRFVASALTPSRVVHTKNHSIDGNMLEYTNNCLKEGSMLITLLYVAYFHSYIEVCYS